MHDLWVKQAQVYLATPRPDDVAAACATRVVFSNFFIIDAASKDAKTGAWHLWSVSDIAADPLWDQYRHLAMEHGLRACWSTPIFSTTREVMGTFALYSRETGHPTPEQVNLIEQMTHLAAVAIERKRAEEALRRSESRFEGILAIAEDAIISIDSNQRIVLFNQGAEKVFGYGAIEVIGKPLDLLLPQRFAQARRGHIEESARSSEASRAMGQRRELIQPARIG